MTRSPRSTGSSRAILLRNGCDAVVVDVHAEATSEKWALGHFADGRASLVVGTHTHVPSADHRILSGGTGFVTDVGMTGDYDSVIGMEKDEPIRRFTRRIPSGRFEPAQGPATLCGVAATSTPEGCQSHCAGQDRRPAQRRRAGILGLRAR